MLVKTRKNKGYTSILMEEISENAFIEANRIYETIEGLKVIKPTKKSNGEICEIA